MQQETWEGNEPWRSRNYCRSSQLDCKREAGTEITGVRRDKREALDKLVAEAQEVTEKEHQGSVYRITNYICGKTRGKQCGPMKDKDGKLLTTEADQGARWTEHFRETLNRPPPESDRDNRGLRYPQ